LAPTSVSEALSGSDSIHWKRAMDTEYNSLIQNSIWQLVDPPPDHNIINTKWLFCRKYKSDGSLARYKARFVARGFSQQEGLNYVETFSPILRMTSLLLLAFATLYNYHTHQMDVTTAFLNGTL